ncbi:MAG: hypothetical protein K5864_06810 [Bacteroidales bacterium]|nr:hypothetical protein [Bacteroidales bacterium]
MKTKIINFGVLLFAVLFPMLHGNTLKAQIDPSLAIQYTTGYLSMSEALSDGISTNVDNKYTVTYAVSNLGKHYITLSYYSVAFGEMKTKALHINDSLFVLDIAPGDDTSAVVCGERLTADGNRVGFIGLVTFYSDQDTPPLEWLWLNTRDIIETESVTHLSAYNSPYGDTTMVAALGVYRWQTQYRIAAQIVYRPAYTDWKCAYNVYDIHPYAELLDVVCSDSTVAFVGYDQRMGATTLNISTKRYILDAQTLSCRYYYFTNPNMVEVTTLMAATDIQENRIAIAFYLEKAETQPLTVQTYNLATKSHLNTLRTQLEENDVFVDITYIAGAPRAALLLRRWLSGGSVRFVDVFASANYMDMETELNAMAFNNISSRSNHFYVLGNGYEEIYQDITPMGATAVSCFDDVLIPISVWPTKPMTYEFDDECLVATSRNVYWVDNSLKPVKKELQINCYSPYRNSQYSDEVE